MVYVNTGQYVREELRLCGELGEMRRKAEIQQVVEERGRGFFTQYFLPRMIAEHGRNCYTHALYTEFQCSLAGSLH